MQMFGIGIMELSVIMILAVLVIGPDRLPQFAADLAKWIRQARAYANHLTKDFNEVMGELEKEVGASREDWKEIASVVNRHTGDVLREVQHAADDAGQPVSNGAHANGNGANVPPPIEAVEPPAAAEPEEATAASEKSEEDTPWYVPERTSTRRRPLD